MCLGVTLSVYPHRAYTYSHRGQADFQPSGEDIYTLRVTPQTHSTPEYITQTTKNKKNNIILVTCQSVRNFVE